MAGWKFSMRAPKKPRRSPSQNSGDSPKTILSSSSSRMSDLVKKNETKIPKEDGEEGGEGMNKITINFLVPDAIKSEDVLSRLDSKIKQLKSLCNIIINSADANGCLDSPVVEVEKITVDGRGEIVVEVSGGENKEQLDSFLKIINGSIPYLVVTNQVNSKK